MVRRVDDGTWAFPGGCLEGDETPEQAAHREFWEETGYRLGDVGRFLMRRIKDGVDYSTFVVDLPEEFLPRLNHEHNSHGWFDPVDVLNGDAEPDLDPEAAQAILDRLDQFEARLGALDRP